MKKLFMALIILSCSHTFGLMKKATFPELHGNLTVTSEHEGMEYSDLELTYSISCTGHRSFNLTGWDDGFALTNCDDDSIELNIELSDEGSYILPELKEFTLEGKKFSCYLVVRAPNFEDSRGNTLEEFVKIPCSKKDRSKIDSKIEELSDLEINFRK
ncbi:MAG: hypothetical protein BM556_15310 [Bacteriovorax sp. MedPE-SWde]|nr:MAG: hypothetical protein BM556_15310 [Bacteriovorax sp. MedPE-SWde]